MITRDELVEALKLHRSEIVEADEWRPLADHVLELVAHGMLDRSPPEEQSTWYTLTWSDREVTAHDILSVAEAVTSCALDHAYDRPSCAVPYGLSDEMSEALKPVVARHLRAKNPDWPNHTVEMNEDECERMRDDLLIVLRPFA